MFNSFRLDEVFLFQSESSVKSGPGCSDYSDICLFQSETVLYGINKEHFLPDEALSISQGNVKILFFKFHNDLSVSHIDKS